MVRGILARPGLLIAILAIGAIESASAVGIFNIGNGNVAALINALNSSNSDNQDDIINLASNGTYTLTVADNSALSPTGLPVIGPDNNHSVIIHGNGSTITRSGSNLFRFLAMTSNSNVSIDSLTISNGSTMPPPGTGYAAGGGIYNNGGTLNLTNCTFNSNSARGANGANGVSAEPNGNAGDAGFGGAVSSNGVLTANGCTFTNNSVQGGNGGNGFGLSGVGGAGGDASGGALDVGGGSTVTSCTFTGNTTVFGGGGTGGGGAGAPGFPDGGAIYITWNSNIAVNVTRCSFDSNTAYGTFSGFAQYPGEGGAIYAEVFAQTMIAECNFTNNHADFAGAAIGTVLSDCLLSGNGATTGGGGIASIGGAFLVFGLSTTATNCTFYNNTAQYGGAIYSDGATNHNTVTNCTLVHNTATVAAGSVYQNATLTNNIFRSGSPTNFSGGLITSQGHNISDDAAEGDNGTGPGGDLNNTGDIRNTSPQLLTSTPQSNGGPTQTFALLVNSPAINHGDDTHAPPRDQRSYSRSGVSDIGSFENNGVLIPLSAVSRKNHAGMDFDVNLPLTGGASGVECRRNTSTDVSGPNAGHDHQVIVTFPYPVTLDNATADHAVTVDPLPSGTNAIYTVNLHNVPNAQLVTISMNHVSDGTNAFTDTIPMGVLSGDTTGDGSVNSADIGQTKSKSGQTVDGTNFRQDANIDASINSADIALVKSRSGTALP